MCTKTKRTLIRVVALFLLIITVFPAYPTMAADATSRASIYLSSYNAYVYLPGTGEVRVYFHVSGTDYMDELGALRVELYESTNGTDWDLVETFNHDTTAGMLSYIDDYHSGYVSYDGVAGRYYQAYVGIWGGKGGQGDARWFWTSVKH